MTDLTSQWEDHRRLRRNFLWTFWYLLAIDVVFLGLDVKLGFTSKYYLQYRLVAIAGWVVPMIFQADKLISWPCPRCGEPFAGGTVLLRAISFWNPLPLECAHCGLSKYATTDDSPAANKVSGERI
jgi:hypothetical protein